MENEQTHTEMLQLKLPHSSNIYGCTVYGADRMINN